MSPRIQNNAHRQRTGAQEKMARSMERLSSGYRINRPVDDVGGLAISETLRGRVKDLAQAQRNVSDAVSLVQIAERAVDQVHGMLDRVRELAVQYGNGALSTAERAAIQSEVSQLRSDIERIGTDTDFNGIKLLGVANGAITFHRGAKDDDVVTTPTISLAQQMVRGTFTLGGANDISRIDASIVNVSTQRATYGALQNRLERAAAGLATHQENLMAAESRIRDVDMAAEMARMSK